MPIPLLLVAQEKDLKNGVSTFFGFENIKVFCFCKSNILKFFPIFLRLFGLPIFKGDLNIQL